MNHEVEVTDGTCYVHFHGEIDLSCSDKVRSVLLDCVQTHALTVVDLSAVRVIDSSGLASLLDSQKTARRRGHGFELAMPSAQVTRVLELAQLNRFLTIRDH